MTGNSVEVSKAHSPAISATTIAEMALFQSQRSLNFFFLSDHSEGNQALVNLTVGLIRIKPVLSLSGLNVSLLVFLICTSLLVKNFQLEYASHEILFILDSMPLSK